MAEAKICGITTIEALDAALDGGARFIGLVFHEKSPRDLNTRRDVAKALAERARGRADIVAVTVNPTDELLYGVMQTIKPDWIQLHGSESPRRAGETRRFSRLGIIKALGVATSEDLAGAAAYEDAGMLLFDAKPPAGADRPGGNALAFDWALLRGRSFTRPWLLSGGLTPENVAEAISFSGAGLVDVSSGVESAPGLKDPSRVAAFLAAAKAA